MKNECTFCKFYEDLKRRGDMKVFVNLLSKYFPKKEDDQSHSVYGEQCTFVHGSYDINYCPECGKRQMTDKVSLACEERAGSETELYRGISEVKARLGIDGETLAKAGLCKNISFWGYKVGDIIRRKGEAEVSMITAIRGGTHDGHVFAFGEWIEDLTQYELVQRDSWERWG